MLGVRTVAVDEQDALIQDVAHWESGGSIGRVRTWLIAMGVGALQRKPAGSLANVLGMGRAVECGGVRSRAQRLLPPSC